MSKDINKNKIGIGMINKKHFSVSTILKKAVRDLWINPGRTITIITALVIGLWGIGSLAVSYTLLGNDLTENFMKTNPSHVTVTSEDFDRLDLIKFRNRPEIESAEFRDLSSERIEVSPNYWIPILLFGVNDFTDLKLAEFYIEKGTKAPSTGTMLIERDGQRISDFETGSITRIRNGKGMIFEVPISGISFDPAQAPSTMDHRIYGYVDKTTFLKVTGQDINQRLIFRLKNIKSAEDVSNQTQTILNDFKEMGIKTKTIHFPPLNEHPHQFQLNSLMFLQGGIGLLAFLMGAVLVWQLMGSLLARQVRQIGVLKAIGASRRQIFNMYLLMAIVLGATASVIAVPLSVVTGNAYAEMVAGILNFEILTSMPFQIYFYLIGAGILLPVLASFPVLIKGIRLPVNVALADYGVQPSGQFKHINKMPLSYRMIMMFRNVTRRKVRLAVTVATMALGAAIFLTGFNLRESLVVMLSDIENATKYDVKVVLKDPLPLEQAMEPFKALTNVERIETWSGGSGIIHTGSVLNSNEIAISAVPYNSDLINLETIKGRWLEDSEPLEMVVSTTVLETFKDPIMGKEYAVEIKGKLHNIKLVGIVREFGPANIYLNKDSFDNAVNPDHLINSLMFVANEQSFAQIFELKKDIEAAIVDSDLPVSSVMSNANYLKAIYDHLDIILTMLTSLALLVLVVSAFGMASAMSINVMERTREIGVLRAVGATPKMIARLFIGEGMVISSFALMLGLLLAWPLSVLVSNFFGGLLLQYPLRYAFSHPGFLITIFVTFAFGWLSSFVPARKANKISTREALSYE